ncbi:hypothetical protein GCM10014713_41440 [Streptomyces purpureus]|uniref:Uncharacterized protein n=1 Tax=Streptomyces purpureus TaxID=1951 RepID=A0A918H8Z4_9ACTN|nr:hypothetical protein GCM10014713_41440 [Streptomyces purpureus]
MLAIGAAAAGGVVYAFPELGYTVAGALALAGTQRARAWAAGRRRSDADEPNEQPVDVIAVLQELGEDGGHVLLTRLRDAAGLPDTKAARALLEDAGVSVRAGVRTPGGNGPGVHATDIPRASATPSGRCLCTSDANANTNNDPEQGPEKGFRVEHTGQAGTTVYDLSETHHHATAK